MTSQHYLGLESDKEKHMAALQPFSPHYGSGQTVTATSAAAASVTINSNSFNVMVTNTGAQIAYVRVGTDSATATAADFPVLAGSQAAITKGSGQNILSYIGVAAGDTTLHIMTGEGWK